MFEIYTDGACKGNPGRGGWGFVIYKDKQKILEKSGGSEFTTNNQMELTAVINALLEFNKYYNDKKMILYTDSMYVKNGINLWLELWKKNNWINSNKDPVKNQDLWQQLDELFDYKRHEIKWIKAHNGNLGNEYADHLANSFTI